MALSGFELLLLLIILGYLVYKFSIRNFDHWKKRGVPYVEPLPLVGNFFDVLTLRITLGHFLAKFYNQFNSRYFGIFVMNTPHLVIKDPELVKAVLAKDFNYFHNRTVDCEESCDSLTSKFLFLLKNPEWRMMRFKMTPVFSTGKIKNMVQLINGCAKEMNEYFLKNIDKKSLDAKEICAKYSTDVIATCAFGINAQSFKNEDAEFRNITRKMFSLSWSNSLRQAAYFWTPGIVKLLRLPFLDPNITKFMRSVFWHTLEEREKSNVKRNDLIDIIVQIKKQGSLSEEFKFEGDRVVAQAGQFFTAGFETISSTLGFTLYELCLQPEIQTKLRAEIKRAQLEHGEFTFDAIKGMNYLHMVVCETLRKYPAIPLLDRMCMEDYKIPGSDLVIEKGTPVFIPMFGLHYDPEYFPDPETFDPERFSEENKSKFPSFAYIPFGEGPRICIGERFGLIVTKMGLCHILSQFEIECSADTPVPLVFAVRSVVLASTVGLPMKFKQLI